MAGLDDGELIRETLAGRLESFEALVERHQRTLYAFVYRNLRNHDAADEVVQATFVQAYTKLASFRGESSFKSWIHEIALNFCRAQFRTSRARQEIPLEEVPEQALAADPENFADGPPRAALERHIARLPHRQRSVLTLRIFSDLTFREIARIEGISENAAKVNYHHAIRRLKEWLIS